MKDKNIVFLEGVIVGDLTYKRASNQKPFCSFLVHTETIGSEGFSSANIYVFVFDQKKIDYLKRVCARDGHRISVMAHLRTSKKDFHGNTIMQTIVTADDVHLIKTS